MDELHRDVTIAFNREPNSFHLNMPGFNFPMTGSYPATINVTSDGTGLSMNVSAGDASTNPGNSFWSGFFEQLAGALRAAICCTYAVIRRSQKERA
jgi:hypothetical protein